jgi:hypothetical protein
MVGMTSPRTQAIPLADSSLRNVTASIRASAATARPRTTVAADQSAMAEVALRAGAVALATAGCPRTVCNRSVPTRAGLCAAVTAERAIRPEVLRVVSASPMA